MANQNFYVDDQTECPSCKEDRETSCRCGWTPGLCLSCQTDVDVQEDGRCLTCFAPDGSENMAEA